jgi:UDP-MurNAc hydroxylase
MEITYLGHAGFLVETQQATVVMDPWLSPEGAFDSGWFQFPCNHHLASFVREKLSDRQKQRFVYVSHEHRDHYDPGFLRSLPLGDLTFVVAQFQRNALRSQLSELHPGAVVSCTHGQEVSIPGGSLKLYLDDSGLNRDSGVLLKADGQAFLNLNDCKLYDEVPAIRKAEGPISVFSCQFSGATWHPTCYDYPSPEYSRISADKVRSKFEMVARAIDALAPRVYIPSAGPACFLDPTLLHLNFQPVNIFPRAAKFQEYLNRRPTRFASQFAEMMPGDEINGLTGQVRPSEGQRVSEDNFETYVRSYAARYTDYFADRQPRYSEQQRREILESLSAELERKLAALSLNEKIRVPLYFGLSDSAGDMLRVDFSARKVEKVSQIGEADYYSVLTPSWQIARVLDHAITWEEFALTFRVRINRKPDVYQTLIQGFLLMEPEDMNWFCSQLLEIEQRQKRLIVEAEGTRYSIDRYCPHQGGDLRQGWCEQGKLWTCPRHRWQFALEKGGECLTSNGSVHAVCLENE